MASLSPILSPTGRRWMILTHFVDRNRLVFLRPVEILFVPVLLGVICAGMALFSIPLTVGLGIPFALALVGLGLAYLVARPVLHPKRTLPQYTPADLDMTNWEEVRFSSGDGVQLGGWFIPPDPAKDGATLIFVHGLGGNRGELLTEAVTLAFHGYGALLFDLRNHGTSQGNITTLGFSEVEDVCGAVRFLSSRREVNLQRIGVVGHSMGAVAAIRAAVRIPQIRAVVAESAYTSLRDNIARGLVAKTGLPPFLFLPIVIWLGERATGLKVDQVAPINDVPKISPRAVMFVHGRNDSLVKYENSRRLYEAANEPKSLVILDHTGHSGMLRSDANAYNGYVVSFLGRYLRSES